LKTYPYFFEFLFICNFQIPQQFILVICLLCRLTLDLNFKDHNKLIKVWRTVNKVWRSTFDCCVLWNALAGTVSLKN